MKSTLVKILAAAMVFVFIFAFSSCKKDSETETTTAAQTTTENTATAENTTGPEETATQAETLPGETTAAVTTLPGETTTAATTLPGQTTAASTAAATTKPAAAIKAPEGTDIAKIVAAYNQYANDTKAFKGTVKATKYSGTNTTINKISPDMKLLRDKANEMLPNDYEKKASITFKNGKDVNGTETLVRYLPRDGEAKMSVLEPAGVKSASCVKSGAGWKITINLKSETVNGLNSVPKYHAQCMDTLNMSDEDLKPFKLTGNPTVTYADGGKIVCTVNNTGLLTEIHIAEPARIVGTLSWTIVDLIDLDVTGTWKQDITLTY